MTGYRKIVGVLAASLLLTGLFGCSMLGYWFSGCGGEDADLVFYNDSTEVVGSVGIQTEQESQGMMNADGTALERGETWGFELTEEAQNLEVSVYDQQGELLACGSFSWPGRGERLWAVYNGGRELRFQWEEP